MVYILPSQSFIAWRACMTLLHVLAMLSTAFRVSTRWRMGKMWWDDYLVFLPTVTDMYLCVSLWAYPPIFRETPPLLISMLRRMWISNFTTLTVVWCSRICFLLSLGRIFPPQHANRRRIDWLIGLFAISYVISFIVIAAQCDPSSMSSIKSKFCVPWRNRVKSMVITFAVHVMSDIILVVCPLVMLWQIKFPSRRDKQMILVALSTNILTTLLLSAMAIFGYGSFKQDMSYLIVMYMLAHMVAAVTLFSCNLLVIVSAIYRAVRASASVFPKSAAYTTSERPTPISLTEIDLSQEPQVQIRFPSLNKPLRRHSVA